VKALRKIISFFPARADFRAYLFQKGSPQTKKGKRQTKIGSYLIQLGKRGNKKGSYLFASDKEETKKGKGETKVAGYLISFGAYLFWCAASQTKVGPMEKPFSLLVLPRQRLDAERNKVRLRALIAQLMVKPFQPTLFDSSELPFSNRAASAPEGFALEGHNWPDLFSVALRSFSEKLAQPPVRTLSLFSGGGGLDIGFHDAGFHIVEMVEVEERYAASLRANARESGVFEGTRVSCGDIRDFAPSDLEVDFLIGGPPCQTFSAAGRRASGVRGTTDERGTLFQEYVRLLETLRPKAFLFENVYGITGAEGGAPWREIQAAFHAAGYEIFSRVLDTADYGVPQHRERLFIVGIHEPQAPFLFPRPTHGPDSPTNRPFYNAGQAVEKVPAPELEENTAIGGRYAELVEPIPPGLNYSFYTSEMGHPRPVFAWRSKFSDFLYKADPSAPVRTIKAQGGLYTGPFSWENRHFTVEEHKRLQTFPDAHILVGNRGTRLEQIGNSVPPQIARILALSVLQQVFGREIPLSLPLLLAHEELGFRKRKRTLTQSYATKAQAALNEHIEPFAQTLPHKGAIQLRFLSGDFELASPRSADEWEQAFAFECRDEADILQIRGARPLSSDEAENYTLTLQAAHGQKWLLPWREVRLTALDSSPALFAGLWKMLEETTRACFGIADLVQLNGYYQYAPKIAVETDFARASFGADLAHALYDIVTRKSVATLLSCEELSARWKSEPSTAFETLNRLRVFGFEVRSRNTNPQIPEGKFLIPYAFPTLCRRSIQGKKAL